MSLSFSLLSWYFLQNGFPCGRKRVGYSSPWPEICSPHHLTEGIMPLSHNSKTWDGLTQLDQVTCPQKPHWVMEHADWLLPVLCPIPVRWTWLLQSHMNPQKQLLGKKWGGNRQTVGNQQVSRHPPSSCHHHEKQELHVDMCCPAHPRHPSLCSRASSCPPVLSSSHPGLSC